MSFLLMFLTLLGQWLDFNLFRITYLVGKIKFKLLFQGLLAKWVIVGKIFPVKLIIHDLHTPSFHGAAGIWSHDMTLFVPWGWIPTAAMAIWVASMCNMPVLLGWYVPMIGAKSSSNVRDWRRVCSKGMRLVKISETTPLKDWVFRPLSKKRREKLMFFVPNNSWIGDGNSNIVD